MLRTVLPAIVVVAGCDVELPPADIMERVACKRRVCDVLPVCSPVVAGGGWDWRTREVCLDTMFCGGEVLACEAAIAALPCIGPGAKPDLHEAHARAVRAVHRACRPRDDGDGDAGGGGSSGWHKPGW